MLYFVNIMCLGISTAYNTVNVKGYSGSAIKMNAMALYASLTTVSGGDLFILSGTMDSDDQYNLLLQQVLYAHHTVVLYSHFWISFPLNVVPSLLSFSFVLHLQYHLFLTF